MPKIQNVCPKEVRKAGEIIPQVVEVLIGKRTGEEKPFNFPRECPECGTPAVRPEGEAVSRCINAWCGAQVRERIRHFASRQAMDIENVGPSLVNQLVDQGLIRDFGDIYSLRKDTISALERMADKSAENVIDAIERSKKAPLDRLVFALGIRMVGTRTAQELADTFGSLEALASASIDELTAVPDVGPRVAACVVEFFSQPGTTEVLDKLRAAGLNMTAEKRERGVGALTGKTFVITGSLSRPRDDFKKIIESAGGKVVTSISKKTDYLLCGEDPGSKFDKAQKLEVEIIDEKRLEEMLASEPIEKYVAEKQKAEVVDAVSMATKDLDAGAQESAVKAQVLRLK